jgi:hypothetical protein
MRMRTIGKLMFAICLVLAVLYHQTQTPPQPTTYVDALEGWGRQFLSQSSNHLTRALHRAQPEFQAASKLAARALQGAQSQLLELGQLLQDQPYQETLGCVLSTTDHTFRSASRTSARIGSTLMGYFQYLLQRGNMATCSTLCSDPLPPHMQLEKDSSEPVCSAPEDYFQ